MRSGVDSAPSGESLLCLGVWSRQVAGWLAEFLKLLERDAELPQDLEKEWRANFLTAMNRNGDSATIWMGPTLVASSLAGLDEA